MKNEELEAITNSIKSKLGDENVALIADDLGTLINKNTLVHSELLSREDEITKLKDDKEKLVIANGNLLQQIPMADTKKKEEKEEDTDYSNFNFKSLFDSKGKFKK